MPQTFKKPVECQTMGHQGCRKLYTEQLDDKWRLTHIVHNVYGREIIEKAS